MAVGSISVFQFAHNLHAVPLAIIGASYSVAAFPYLADLYAQKRYTDFSGHIAIALRHIIFWSLPVVGLLIVLRAHVVRVVLGSGEFSWTDTRLTAALLALLSISLVAQAVTLLMVRAFYASTDTRTPFWVTLVGTVCTATFTWFMYHYYLQHTAFASVLNKIFRIEGVEGGEILIVGACYSLVICVQAAMLMYLAFKKLSIPSFWLLGSFVRAGTATLVGAVVSYITLQFFAHGINEATLLGIFIQGAFAGCLGIVGVMLTYSLLRSPELVEIYKSFHSKVFKVNVVAPQEDIL
jgi:putative peptidoglycan lipid II flippase